MSLDDMLATDSAIHVDANASFDVETIDYWPNGVEDAAVEISARVFRNPPEDGEIGPDKVLTIYIRRDADAGRTSVDAPGDRVSVAFNKGGTAELFNVTQIEREDAGGFWLKLE